MESAALSARAGADRPLRASEGVIEGIFSSLVVLEDTLMGGRQLLKGLSDPIARIDAQGPIYPPDVQIAEEPANGIRQDPSLIDKLARAHKRIEDLRELAMSNNQIVGEAIKRLDAAV